VQKLTATEEGLVRAKLLPNGGQITVAFDGVWFCDVADQVFEAETLPALLRELADMLEVEQ
jgi:hypothetical protein